MNASDDDDWVDGLAGRAHDGTRAAREGAQLRRALLNLEPRDVQGQEAPSASVAREDQLLRRAGQAGLRTAAAPAWQRGRWLALAASIALVALGINWWPQTPDATIAVRSTTAPIARRAADDPPAAQRRLLAQLAAAGISARGYEMLGRYGVDADLPQELTAGQRALLSQYGIAVAADRVLRIEFMLSGEQ